MLGRMASKVKEALREASECGWQISVGVYFDDDDFLEEMR